MISKDEFIKSVKGRKERSQRYFVKILRSCFKFKKLSFGKYLNGVSKYTYLTICRCQDFDMVLASVYTLYKYSEVRPNKVILVSDGSWKLENGYKYFEKYNLPLECIDWTTAAYYYKTKCPSLVKWAEKHIWGKKMAAILYESEKAPVLFSDPDILWYNTPITESDLKKLKFKISIDNSHNYDNLLIEKLSLHWLYDREPINCGAVFISGGLSLLSNDALQCIEEEGKKPGPFAEQTVFAVMDKDYDCRWTMQEITSEIDDLVKPFWSRTIFYKGMMARHYLWRLKWIYWKDLFRHI